MKIGNKAMAAVFGTVLVMGLAGCGAAGAGQGGTTTAAEVAAPQATLKDGDKFPSFKATDIATGKSVDESVFKQNKVTVVSYWFNGCSACVNEMPILEQLNKQLKDKGVGVLGVNAEGDNAAEEAKGILSKQGVTYSNLMIDPSSEGAKVGNGIMAFPTTFLVDQNGNVIGEPMQGGIGQLEGSELLQRVNDALAKSQA